jgi:hypothetical protein
MNMAETIKNLQKDFQSHKVYNERPMRSKDQLDDLNINLLESLNIIEKKLDKKSGSSKSGIHRPYDEKIKQRSVSRHH